jgi:hypothetical protein
VVARFYVSCRLLSGVEARAVSSVASGELHHRDTISCTDLSLRSKPYDSTFLPSGTVFFHFHLASQYQNSEVVVISRGAAYETEIAHIQRVSWKQKVACITSSMYAMESLDFLVRTLTATTCNQRCSEQRRV